MKYGGYWGIIRENFTEKKIFEKKPEPCSCMGKSIPGLGNSKTDKNVGIAGLGHGVT